MKTIKLLICAMLIALLAGCVVDGGIYPDYYYYGHSYHHHYYHPYYHHYYYHYY